MKTFLSILITAAVAYIGGKLGEKLKLPSGAMTGSMLCVAAMNIIFKNVYFDATMKYIMMVFSGFIIGTSVNKKDIKAIPRLLPVIIIVISMLGVYSMGMGVLTSKLTELSLATALFSFVPGGVTDMAAISEGIGANTAQVSILQIWRLLNIFLVIPPLFRLYVKKHPSDLNIIEKNHKTEEKSEKPKYSVINIVLAILSSYVGSKLFGLLGMSSGVIIGAILGSTIFGTAYKKVEYPSWMKFVSKLLSGIYLGSQMDLSVILNIGKLIIPAILMTFGIVVTVFVSAYIIDKLTSFDYKLGLISSTPGGLQEMYFIAEEIGADAPKAATVQTARLFGVYLIFPPLIELIFGLLSN